MFRLVCCRFSVWPTRSQSPMNGSRVGWCSQCASQPPKSLMWLLFLVVQWLTSWFDFSLDSSPYGPCISTSPSTYLVGRKTHHCQRTHKHHCPPLSHLGGSHDNHQRLLHCSSRLLVLANSSPSGPSAWPITSQRMSHRRVGNVGFRAEEIPVLEPIPKMCGKSHCARDLFTFQQATSSS